jgi:hypothetical protein
MSRAACTTLFAAIFALSLLATPPLAAQDIAVPAAAPTTTATTIAPVSAPTAQQATVGVRRLDTANLAENAIRQDREPRPVALMIVGGATMLVGTVIGGDAGTIVTIGGAVVFLVGVFRYVN